jgi:hypothetical protein
MSIMSWDEWVSVGVILASLAILVYGLWLQTKKNIDWKDWED